MSKNEVLVKRVFEARPAALFVQLAGKFQSEIKIGVGNKKTNCKSLMGVIALGVTEGVNVVLTAEGADAEAAIKELSEFLITNE